jgi:hypothetical protein
MEPLVKLRLPLFVILAIMVVGTIGQLQDATRILLPADNPSAS